MNIVITMAGEGKRFKEVGYIEPKFMIKVRGKTLFEWAMLSLKDLNKYKDTRYIFVVQKKTKAQEFIRQKMQELGVDDVGIVEIDSLTDGQATTVLAAEPYWQAKDELVIYNIDTYVESGIIKYADFNGDGFVPCFKGDGEHWSFCGLDKSGKVIKIAEKKRISEYCSVGLYYFKNGNLYIEAYKGYYGKNLLEPELGEKYIAPMYNWLIDNGYEVKICDLPKEKVHCLGTPSEVEIFKTSC